MTFKDVAIRHWMATASRDTAQPVIAPSVKTRPDLAPPNTVRPDTSPRPYGAALRYSYATWRWVMQGNAGCCGLVPDGAERCTVSLVDAGWCVLYEEWQNDDGYCRVVRLILVLYRNFWDDAWCCDVAHGGVGWCRWFSVMRRDAE